MPLSLAILIVLVGVLIGVVSGLVGIGGGILVIPVLMFAFGFSQVRANGTSIAMLLPPIGIFAALSYARAGNIDWRFAALLALGFALGAYGGAKLVNSGAINPTGLRVMFAALLLYVAGRLLFRPGGAARSAMETLALMGGVLGVYGLMRLLGRHWSTPHNWAAIYRAKRQATVEYDYEI